MREKSVLVKRVILFAVCVLIIALAALTGAYAALSPTMSGKPWQMLWLALASSLVVTAIVILPLQKLFMRSSITEISKLRDIAVRLAAGDFDARANEHARGEIGELGLALNNLSNQLSKNMYSLIVERNRLKHMLNGLSEGIVAVDVVGKVTHRNPVLKRMFEGVSRPAGAHGIDSRLRIIPDPSVWADFDYVCQHGGARTRNLEVRDMALRMVISPIIDDIGTTVGAVGLFSDITQLERLERTRRDYVANVSHEMRTPLTAMRALIEPLKEGMVTSEEARMRYYDIILREVMRLSRLINDLMELSRLQSGKLAVKKERMKLTELVNDVCERYADIALDHSLDFELATDMSNCPSVICNADRVEQILVILLDNAIKYTPEGGKIGVSAKWDDKRVILSVRDNGIGVSQEDLPYIFDRFYKADKAHSGLGSGLGLSIAKELLRWLNEDIWVKSEQGRGSEFSFSVRRDI